MPGEKEQLSDLELAMARTEAVIALQERELSGDDLERERERIAKANRKDLERAKEDLRTIVRDPRVRRTFLRILEIHWPEAPSFSSDPLVMARNEGRRSVTLTLKGWIESADPNAYPQMLRERESDLKSSERDEERA